LIWESGKVVARLGFVVDDAVCDGIAGVGHVDRQDLRRGDCPHIDAKPHPLGG
jgi:hypothetical protein